MIRDRDCIYGVVVTRRLRAMGIRDKPIAPASQRWKRCRVVMQGCARTSVGGCDWFRALSMKVVLAFVIVGVLLVGFDISPSRSSSFVIEQFKQVDAEGIAKWRERLGYKDNETINVKSIDVDLLYTVVTVTRIEAKNCTVHCPTFFFIPNRRDVFVCSLLCRASHGFYQREEISKR
jgi:hypothetical protein